MNEGEKADSKKKKSRKALPRIKTIKNTEEATKITGGEYKTCPNTSATQPWEGGKMPSMICTMYLQTKVNC